MNNLKGIKRPEIPQWVGDYNVNKQDSKELEYFQKIQVLKQQISALQIELGKANAEIAHLNHALSEKVTHEFLHRYASLVTKRSMKAKYAKVMNELIVLRERTSPPRQPESPPSTND